MYKSCEKWYLKKKPTKNQSFLLPWYMWNQLYALLYNLAHSAVSLQCEDLHEQANLNDFTSYDCDLSFRDVKIMGQLRLKILTESVKSPEYLLNTSHIHS